MHLYILRHGIAVEGYEWHGPDATRPLTPDGKKRTRKVLETLYSGGKLELLEALWASPLVRAQQTAAIAAEVLSLPVKTVDALACGATLSSLGTAFKGLTLPERLLWVGHEPDCGAIIGALVGDPAGDYALKKAGLAALKGDFAAGKMTLKWKLSPSDVLKD